MVRVTVFPRPLGGRRGDRGIIHSLYDLTKQRYGFSGSAKTSNCRRPKECPRYLMMFSCPPCYNNRTIMKNKTAIFAGVILACVCVVTVGLFLLIQESFFIRKTGAIVERFFGYRINAARICLVSALKAEITDLSISGPNGGAIAFVSSQANIESSLSGIIRSKVERIILREPKLQIHVGNRKDSRTDLSFIKKLPPVDLLEVRKGELRLLLASPSYEIAIKDISLDVRGFSPKKGGIAVLTGVMDIVSRENPHHKVLGLCRGEFNLTRFFPFPSGSGFLETTVESGSLQAGAVKNGTLVVRVTFEDDKVVITEAALSVDSVDLKTGEKQSALKGIKARTDLTYESKSGRFYARKVKGEIPGLGVFEGSAKGMLRNDYPWHGAIEAKDINFTRLFAVLGSFMESAKGDQWSVRGEGALKAEIEGTMAGTAPGAKGRASLRFKRGEFSSKDGTKAGQGIDGEIAVRFIFPSAEGKRKDINASLSLSSGEYLWGRYYNNFGKENAKVSSNLALSIRGDRRLDFNGTADLFNTGTYSYRGSIGPKGWGLFVDLKGISNKDIFTVLLSDYLGQVYPSLRGAEVGGRLDAEIHSQGKDNGFTITGFISTRDAFFRVPEKSLAIDRIDVSLPLDLSSPFIDPDTLREDNVKTGMIWIKTIQSGAFTLSDLEIPVAVSENSLWISKTIDIPFFGGYINILRYKAANVLSPSRRFYVTAGLQNIDLGAFLRELTGLEFPGTMEARFPMITYRDGTWMTEGKASVKIFGGEVDLSNFHGQQILGPSRRIGGDIAFRDINLGSITETIKIGRITGIVEGSIQGLEMEYGQPSRFVLDIDSVKKPGVRQKVSVDAIENISILGTGSGGVGMILKSGLNRFFREYPYSRIGIRCILENDTFHIRGKIFDGKQEYLVRRGFLRGIDIINRDPDNTINFRDMQERVSRVFKDRKKGQAPQGGVN